MRYRPISAAPADPRLGRLIPDDWKHVERFPARSVLPSAPETVEKTLLLPTWHWTHDQGREGSCVGHGCAMERAITNTNQNRMAHRWHPGRRYDPLHIWDEAKRLDEWPDTNPGDDNGTSVRAGYDVLRTIGARVIAIKGITISPQTGIPEVLDTSHSPDMAEGVDATRWATTVDEIRSALDVGLPVTIGINWYAQFDTPVVRYGEFGRGEHWIGDADLGRIRGGHCVCIYGASDKREAVKIKNSWGRAYPLVWLPYSVMERLLDEEGEAALVTDR